MSIYAFEISGDKFIILSPFNRFLYHIFFWDLSDEHIV